MTWVLTVLKIIAQVLGLVERESLKGAGRDEQRVTELEDAQEATADAQDIDDRVRRYSGTELSERL